VEELKELGLRGVGEAEVTMDGNGYVLAELPGTAPGRVGLCAHIDTAPAFTGTGVSPRLVERYDGGAIDVGHGIVLDPADTPELAECLGDTIITTDGRTLLGADDKAGIAAIMAALEILVQQPEIPGPRSACVSTPTRRSAGAPTASRWSASTVPWPSPSTGASPARSTWRRSPPTRPCSRSPGSRCTPASPGASW
jgi:tripeptide aminopeptidase